MGVILTVLYYVIIWVLFFLFCFVLFVIGVYQTTIDAGQQRVTVSGNVDSETLIKKFLKAGKHAVLWSSDHNNKTNNQNQKQSNPKDNNNNNNNISQKKAQPKEGIEPRQNQQKLPNPSPQEEENDEEDEAQLTQQEATTDPKNPNANGKGKGKEKANGNWNGGKKGNPSQSNGGIDQKVMAAAAAMKLKTPEMAGGLNIDNQGGEMKRGGNEMNSMVGGPTVLGGNPTNAMAGGGFQMPPQPNKNGCPSFAGYPVPNVMGVGTSTAPPPSMVMNFNGHAQALHQQQQPKVVMYHMAPPMVPPNTGYYNSLPYSGDYYEAMNGTNEEKTSGSGCSIM